MRTFNEVSKTLVLLESYETYKGILYTPEDKTHHILIRHFDKGLLSKELIEPYLEVVQGVRGWINERGLIKRNINFDDYIEIGEDFIMRKFHILFNNSLWSYDRNRGKLYKMKFPKKITELRDIVRKELGSASTKREKIIEEVIYNSIISSASKTSYVEGEDTLELIEPSISRENLLEWIAESE